MSRPEPGAPGDSPLAPDPPSAASEGPSPIWDRTVARLLLSSLGDDESPEPPGLVDRVRSRVNVRLMAHDLVDLCTLGFFSSTVLPVARRLATAVRPEAPEVDPPREASAPRESEEASAPRESEDDESFS